MGSFKLGKMTFSSLFKQPETVQYPEQKKEPPAGLKGHVSIDFETCILCGICAKRCPCGAITTNKAERTWAIDRFRCVQCGTCVRECPKTSLTMEPTYAPCATVKSVDTVEVPDRKKAATEQEKKPSEPSASEYLRTEYR